MRLIHICVAIAALILFLVCPISVSRSYLNSDDTLVSPSVKSVALNTLELSGFDFISGNLPSALNRFYFPRSLAPHRAGAIFCLAALIGLLIAAVFANRIFNPATGNLFLLSVYLSGFIFVENFKNEYFVYATDSFSSKYQSITVDSLITMFGIALNVLLFCTALYNLIFLFSKKLKRNHREMVH
jgi:hypothetical protein